jgi:hypothetical protein
LKPSLDFSNDRDMDFNSSQHASSKYLRQKEESARKLLELRSRAETPTLKNVKENLFIKYDVNYRANNKEQSSNKV